jgi:hypothetical protein
MFSNALGMAVELFLFSIATGLNPWQLKIKKRERTARPRWNDSGSVGMPKLLPFNLFQRSLYSPD